MNESIGSIRRTMPLGKQKPFTETWPGKAAFGKAGSLSKPLPKRKTRKQNISR